MFSISGAILEVGSWKTKWFASLDFGPIIVCILMCIYEANELGSENSTDMNRYDTDIIT